MIVFCHIELVRHYRGFNTPVTLHWIYETGKVAVSAFFVMSGFLITWLLLAEKEKSQTVSIKHFYLRRALRIWPLYYLLVALIFFVLPQTGLAYLPGQTEEFQKYFGIKLFFFLALMPQMLFLKFKPVPGGEQFWTIGAEEIFYFIWPWFIKKAKHLPTAIFVLLALYWSTRYLSIYSSFLPYWKHRFNLPDKIYLALYYNRVDCILLGGLCGYFFYGQNALFARIISSRIVVVLAAIALLLLFALSARIGPFDYFDYSLLFAVLVSALAKDNSAKAPGIFEMMGKLSYGIYLWHFVAIFLAFFLLKGLEPSGLLYAVALYGFSYGITFILAFLSYHLFEKWFLRFKRKYEEVPVAQDNQV